MINKPIGNNKIKINIAGKTIGDSVESPVTSKFVSDTRENLQHILIVSGVNTNAVLYCSNYYIVGTGENATVYFLTGLPMLDGTQLTALVLSGNEFTLVGVTE